MADTRQQLVKANIMEGIEKELSKLGREQETAEERALRLASLVILVQQLEDGTQCGGWCALLLSDVFAAA